MTENTIVKYLHSS